MPLMLSRRAVGSLVLAAAASRALAPALAQVPSSDPLPSWRDGAVKRAILDDGEREYAHDRTSRVGKLDRALTDAPAKGWLLASMRNDWARVFP